MAITRVHHVGLVTGDLEYAQKVFVEGFGLSVDEHRTPLPQGKTGYDGTSILEFPIGEMYYEIAKPNDSDSNAAQFLTGSNGRGGMYYLSLASDDITGDIQRITSNGGKLLGDWDGKSSVCLDPSTSLGLRIEITPDDPYYVHPYYKGNGTCMGMAHIGIAGRDPEESRGFWGGMLGVIVVNFIITYFFFRFVDLDKLEEQIIYLQYFQVPVVFFWWAGLWKSADKHKDLDEEFKEILRKSQEELKKI